mgnify:CR=1 FL=1
MQLLVPIPQVIEMRLKRKDMKKDCIDINHPNATFPPPHTDDPLNPIAYAIINPLEDSRAGHSSIDEEKFKELVWPKIVMAKPE